MTKVVAVDAGHGVNTQGKKTPAGEREWTFNNRKALALIAQLNTYAGVKTVRLDDPTGRTDVSLSARTNKANAEKADLLISLHHNANTGNWGGWTGTETYIFPGDSASRTLANALHPILVKAMGLRDRGIKQANFHMLRESNAPSILTEGGFMDSTIDIKKLRNNNVLDKAGRDLADGIARYLGLKKKSTGSKTAAPKKQNNNKGFVWVGTNLKGKRVESIYRGSDRLNFYDGPRWSNPSGTFGFGEGWKVDNLYRVDGHLMYRVQNSKGDLYWITASSKYVRVR